MILIDALILIAKIWFCIYVASLAFNLIALISKKL